jgi:ribonuclease Z
VLLEEAREIFPGTVVPRDFDTIEVPFAERGTPELVRFGDRPVEEQVEEPVPDAG